MIAFIIDCLETHWLTRALFTEQITVCQTHMICRHRFLGLCYWTEVF